MTDQNRKGAGAPNPGHFAGTQKSDADFDLGPSAGSTSVSSTDHVMIYSPDSDATVVKVIPELGGDQITVNLPEGISVSWIQPVATRQHDGTLVVAFLGETEEADEDQYRVVQVALDTEYQPVLTTVSEETGAEAHALFVRIAGYVPVPAEPMTGTAVYADYDFDREAFTIGDDRVEVSAPGMLLIGGSPTPIARRQADGTTKFAYLSQGYSGQEDNALVIVHIDGKGTVLDYTSTGYIGEVTWAPFDILAGPEQANAPLPDDEGDED